MGPVILGKISVFQTCCHIGEMLSRAILLTNSCSTLPKNWIAIITLGHESIYASLKISYQAPHHWDATGALEISGLFSSMKQARLGRNLDLSLYHPVLCLDPETFPGCQTASLQPLSAIACSLRIYISLALIPSWNTFCGINKHCTHLSITVSFGRVRMWGCLTPDAEKFLLWVFRQAWSVRG